AGPFGYAERLHPAVRRYRPERVDLMELRHLRYFVAVAEEGSFVRAAGRLRVAQPALSKQIRDLEREVGVKLFERLPRGARVTRAGEQFLGNARSALESATRAVTTARRSDSATGLKFAHSDLYVYTPVLLKVLAAFRQAAPEILVRVVRVNDVDQQAALREHRIDIAAAAGAATSGPTSRSPRETPGPWRTRRWPPCTPTCRDRSCTGRSSTRPFPCGLRSCGAAMVRHPRSTHWCGLLAAWCHPTGRAPRRARNNQRLASASPAQRAGPRGEPRKIRCPRPKGRLRATGRPSTRAMISPSLSLWRPRGTTRLKSRIFAPQGQP